MGTSHRLSLRRCIVPRCRAPPPLPPPPPTAAVRSGGTMVSGLRIILSKASLICRRRRRRKRDASADGGGSGTENNNSWLLAEAESMSGAEIDQQHTSVHSSFRFSFGSQAEAETATPIPGDATVLLLVSVQDNEEEEGADWEAEAEAVVKERLRWQRLQSLERSIAPVVPTLLRFTYREIRFATKNFSKGGELGRGPLSRVYKGRIGLRRRAVAIKRVEGEGRESAKAFCRELMIASSLRHSNVVPLLGFCVGPEGFFLVYKFISGGNLGDHLHQHEKGRKRKGLSWEMRYKVAVGVARAVQYLHHSTDKCVVHRDIKPSNILLSSNKTPKLCDFGLATWTHGPSQPFLCKAVKGTFGYLAPEYFQHGKLSDKTDIYAFGVVLLELITGRKAIDRSRPQGDENLVLWAKGLMQKGVGVMAKLIDPNLKLSLCNRSGMDRMILAASACLNSEESRPGIDQVIGMLKGEEQMFTDWSLFTGNGCLTGYGSQLHDLTEKTDMKGHLALAMLGVSDTEEEDLYQR